MFISENNNYFKLRSHIVTPDNDGVNDFIVLDYELPETNYILDLYLYDRWGRNQHKLLHHYTLNRKGTIIIKEAGIVRSGVYILLGTLHHLNSKFSL
jgi:hypothetical protein